ncbi:hypothetical protein KY290_010600 [Solanum tuberosum]|uniref:Uncharacterized protein n=1 Tax=Solanum tuberosum TaxID=4113 RepID=A0ABQ7VY88_SOLTU|nr:hypothetical protein KY290_010600 [Solanum tuberosum]
MHCNHRVSKQRLMSPFPSRQDPLINQLKHQFVKWCHFTVRTFMALVVALPWEYLERLRGPVSLSCSSGSLGGSGGGLVVIVRIAASIGGGGIDVMMLGLGFSKGKGTVEGVKGSPEANVGKCRRGTSQRWRFVSKVR